MKISKSKQELARIISKNGGWRDGAEWATQDHVVAFFSGGKPKHETYDKTWCANGDDGVFIVAMSVDGKIGGFHNTILSRVEYFHIYPVPDADGWIEWKGGECPVGEGDRIDVKFSDGDEFFDVSSYWGWGADAGCCNIIAYRLHKPEQSLGELCGEAKEENKHEHIDAKPTIEQLATDYRNRKDYADRKQQEADDAKADADEKLRVLELAGEAHGLLVTPITSRQEPELVIAVQVGDEVECIKSNVNPGKYMGRHRLVC